MYLKIANLFNSDGTADYKGLNLAKIQAGSPIYPNTENAAYLSYSGSLPAHADIAEITETDYQTAKTDMVQGQPENQLTQLSERLSLMQVALDDLIMGGL